MDPDIKFADGEKVLCYHSSLLYEAKCLQSKVRGKIVTYLVHYTGWNKSWDEWLPEDQLLKYNTENLHKQKELKVENAKLIAGTKKKSSTVTKSKEIEERNTATDKASSSTATAKIKKSVKEKKAEDTDTSTSSPSPTITKSKKAESKSKQRESAESGTPAPSKITGTKRKSTTPIAQPGSESSAPKQKNSDTSAAEKPLNSKVEFKIKVPEELNPFLISDWEAVCKQRKVLKLPVTNTVENIIDEYIQKKQTSTSQSPNEESVLMEVARGILEYFNVLLGKQLLYKSERLQYDEMVKKNPEAKMSTIYGASHLLRLFVKLGAMVAHAQIEDKQLQVLAAHVDNFLKYLAKNSTKLFGVDEYILSRSDRKKKVVYEC